MTTSTESPFQTSNEAQMAWIANAVDTVARYADTHPYDLFTTKEIWALLDNPPGDRRAMGAVMHIAVREGHVHRSTLVPDPGAATTKDGVSFPFNKPVWAYRNTADIRGAA